MHNRGIIKYLHNRAAHLASIGQYIKAAEHMAIADRMEFNGESE